MDLLNTQLSDDKNRGAAKYVNYLQLLSSTNSYRNQSFQSVAGLGTHKSRVQDIEPKNVRPFID